MKWLRRLLRKYANETVRNIIIWFLKTFKMNNKIILYSKNKAQRNRVNLNYWSDVKNLGDAISPVVVNFVASEKNIDVNTKVDKTKHLFAIGSIITAGSQDCTIWGSGFLNTRILSRLKNRKLDVRAVRGPLTRMILMDYGYDVPEVYGDPAILMPLIYNPEVSKEYRVSVITHMNEGSKTENFHYINILTDDYKTFIEEIKKSELVISSSLHGIILAEVYGVPAVLLKPKMDLFKYYDYYFSTKRYEFPMIESLESGDIPIPLQIPDFKEFQTELLKAFPKDLWE